MGLGGQTRQRLVVLGLLALMGLLRIMPAVDPFAEPLRVLFSPVANLVAKASFNYQPADIERPAESAYLDELLADNDRLRASLNFTSDLKLRTLGANIIRKDLSTFNKFLIINQGSADGVERGQAVLAGDALVGVIDEVSDHRAIVRLLGDPQLRVTAHTRSSRAHGVVKTVNGSLVYDLVPDTNLAGRRLETDGLDGRFAAGLTIGQIGERLSGDDDNFQRYRLTLPINAADIAEVLVVKGVAE